MKGTSHLFRSLQPTHHAPHEVYAPRPVSLEDAAVRGFADLAQREAYEAAAFGPRGVCLKEQGGAECGEVG